MKMSVIWTLAVFTFLTTKAIVDCNPQSLSSGVITKDVLRRLDELEFQDRKQHDELEALREENAQLRQTNVELTRRIDKHELEGRKQHAKLEAFHEENAQLRETNVELTREIDNLKKRLLIVEESQHIKTKVNLQKPNGGKDMINTSSEKLTEEQVSKPNEINNSADNGDFVAVRQDGQASALTKAHSRIRQSNQGSDSTIAFFATRTSHAQHLGQHQAVIFDHIITNIGQAYHNTIGIFIAPVSGVYVFSTTILSFKEEAHFSYAINGIAQTNLYAYQGDTYETTSQTAIFHLNKGDDVAIHNNDLDKFVHGDRYSTFSGFLLVPTEGDLILG